MIEDLLRVADDLAKKKKPTEVALRRATSSAYYAAFHALCETVAGSMCSDPSSRLYDRLYRLVEHRHLDEGVSHFYFSDVTRKIRLQLDNLRQKRIEADYAPRQFPYSSREVVEFVTEAANVINALRGLETADREELAANLLSRISEKSRAKKD